MSRCKHCGARSIPLRKVCDYCGTPVGQGFEFPAPSDSKSSPAGPGSDFDRLLAHPDLARVVEAGPHVPPPRERREGPPKEMILLGFFGFVFWKAGGFEKLTNGMSFVPLAFMGLAIFATMRRRSRQKAFPGAHVESLPVRIDGVERDEDWPRAKWVKVMVQSPSGERRRLRYHATGQESWSAHDLGVAHIKANVLVEFHHLRF